MNNNEIFANCFEGGAEECVREVAHKLRVCPVVVVKCPKAAYGVDKHDGASVLRVFLVVLVGSHRQ
jgi:hypothetical protein